MKIGDTLIVKHYNLKIKQKTRKKNSIKTIQYEQK